MKLNLISHAQYQEQVPATGRHILCQEQEGAVVVYQAYRASIAAHAVSHQRFGGADYSYGRMSWIKPNFLWMMYRSGWGTKEGQEHVLAIWIKKEAFEKILGEAVHSSYKPHLDPSAEVWKECLTQTNVMLQWDPDHDIYEAKEQRRAIQLGLRREMLEDFGKEMILHIEDIGDYAREQKKLVEAGAVDQLQLPSETTFVPSDAQTRKKLELTKSWGS